MLEEVTLVGFLVKAEEKTSKAGTSYTELVLGVDRTVGSEETTIWWKVALTGALAEPARRMMSYYQQGRQLMVKGKMITSAFEGSNGELKVVHRLLAEKMPVLLDKKRTAD